MYEKTIRGIVADLSEKAYVQHLVTRRLVELGVLKPGEISSLYDQVEKAEFERDFLQHLVSIGLEIDGSPS